jgi:hypothetical protein
MKLGETLVQKGLLTAEQLEIGLKSQLILGGHLGTALIELGFIDEDTLGEVLSKMFGVPYAPNQLFANIGEPTIAAVPQKIAEEYGAIPIKVEDKFVHLALVNVSDLRILDELSFALGRRVIPWISSEVRIYQALETYYGVARRPRFITIGHQLDEAIDRKQAGSKKVADVPAAETRSPEPSASAGTALSDESQDALFEYGKSWLEIAEELDRRAASEPAPEPKKAPAPPRDKPTERPGRSGSPMPLTELAQQYCRADSHDDLARAAVEFSVGRAERMLLVTIRAKTASVWRERGLGLALNAQRPPAFRFTTEPLFDLLMDGHYHGPLPENAEVQSFYGKLGVDVPQEILLIPIRVNDLLVAIALIDGGPAGRIQGNVEELLSAFRLFGMSVNVVMMRRKIREAAKAEAPALVAEGQSS